MLNTIIIRYPNTDLPARVNEEILKAEHAYIRKTKRFMS